MSDIFISYARSTAAQAQKVAEALRTMGYGVWLDDELPAHRAYADVIDERLRLAKAVVVIWSAEAVKSQWVRSESDRARLESKLVQLSVDGTSLPMPFDQIQCADLTGWTGDVRAPGWRKVAASIADLTSGSATSPNPISETSRPPARKLSICVLPFANMSGEAEQEHFSDGLGEDIITDLSEVSAFHVVARNTSFQFKGKGVDVQQIARQLKVSHVLEGSVRKVGGRVRITAQLIDGVTGGHVWAERYDRDLDQIFALQDEISHAIVGAITLKLLPQESKGTERSEITALKNSPVKYARSGDVHIAYRVFGDGPRDIVLVPGMLSHVEIGWERPSSRHLIERLTAFARVIVFDKRGQGLSDRVGEQTLEERISDVRAVMDAAGSERATIYGWSEGGAMCLTFAATFPERTAGLVLFGTFASMRSEPMSQTRETYQIFLDDLEAHWGEGVAFRVNMPSRADDAAYMEWGCHLERASASPGSIVALMKAAYEIDVRHLLATIQAPTLILHRVGDNVVPVASGRYLARQIPGARYVELPGVDHVVLDNETQDVIADEIAKLFTVESDSPIEPERVLATVMFTDLVRTPERAVESGDARWSELISKHYAVLRQELAAFRGHEVRAVGESLQATFDGPARAVRCARAMCEKLRPLGLQLRVGLHTGECDLSGDEISGIAVDTAAQVANLARPDEVMVSSTLKDLVAGSGLQFTDRGTHTLKGVPGEWQLFVVRS